MFKDLIAVYPAIFKPELKAGWYSDLSIHWLFYIQERSEYHV